MNNSTPPSAIFPERLRTARELRKLNQGELAQRSGLQDSAISHFETGTRKPSFDNLRRLADALDVTTDYLLGRTADAKAPITTDKLYRHLDQLSSKDRDIAEGFLNLLADQAKNKTPKE